MSFKVVEKQTRWGSNWAIFKEFTKTHGFTNIYKKGLEYKKKHPEFFPRYFRGKVVRGAPGTLGIMCFPTKAYAERFKRHMRCEDKVKIIKVRGIGKPRKVNLVVRACGNYPWRLTGDSGVIANAPKGTVAYETVEVLE